MNVSTIPGGFIVPNDSHIGKWQQECGKLEHDNYLPAFVCSRLKPGDFIIDCGAFDGDHTIAYSKAVGISGAVLAVEAGDLAFECLRHNINLFDQKNVIALKAILGQQPGFFGIHEENPNLGASRCIGVAGDEKNSIPTTSIDEISQVNGRKINFIKMDIEGWELFALRGAKSVLNRDRPEMLIEINRGALAENRATPKEIIEFLESNQYRWNIMPPYCKFVDPQFDIHCIPA